ncbi:hypothetical protein V2J09_004676 [Rumex salicifolius]
MEAPLLSSAIVFFSVALVVCSTSLPAEQYWTQVLPNTPMPKAIKDSLHANSASVGVAIGKGGTKVHVSSPKSGTGVSVGKGSGTKVHVSSPKTKTGVVVGKGGTSVHVSGPKKKGTYVSVKPGPKGFLYKYAATETQLHDDPNTALFFLEKDLITPKEKTMNLRFTPGSSTAFLPRHVAESVPFSSDKLPEILDGLNISPGSPEAVTVESTVKECEETPVKGEDKRCVASLEGMMDYATSKLGKRVSVVSTDSGDNKEEKYKVVKVKMLGREKEARAVVCHKQSYAYAVFYCHETETTRVYEVSLVGTKAKVKAVAVCHTDTSVWNPKHLAFKVLKVKPGTVPVCHFLPEDHVVWVSK